MAQDSRATRGPLALAGVLAGLGTALSGYATWHHFQVKALGQTDAACNLGGAFSCDDVARSAYAEFAGMPLGVWGIAFYLSTLLLLAMLLWGKTGQRQGAGGAYQLLAALGAVISLGLAYLSIEKVGSWCVVCIGVYSVNALQLAPAFFFRRQLKWPAPKDLLHAVEFAAILVALIWGGFRLGISSEEAPSPAEAPPALTPETANYVLSEVHDIPLALTRFSGLGEDYRLGSDQAKVTIVEFSDFQCPACGRMNGVIKQLIADYGDQIRFVYKNYPLDPACNAGITRAMHPQACSLAIMARCAGQFGKFWPYHDLVFALQEQISESNVVQWAEQVGLTREQAEACLASEDLKNKVVEDIAAGNKLGVSGTPTLFINGQKFVGGGLEALRLEIDKRLR